MPCDSVATVQAKINQEVFNKFLTVEKLKSILPNLLKEKLNLNVSMINSYGGLLELYIGEYIVIIEKNSINVINRSYGASQLKVSELKDSISELLKEITAKATQIGIQEIINNIGKITNVSNIDNSLVIDVEI